MYKRWDYPYKIFSEIPVFSSSDPEVVKREEHVMKLSVEKYTWMKAMGYIVKSKLHEQDRELYKTVQDLADGVYNIGQYEKKYGITKDFKKLVKELF